ncbi:uncharacterized protein TNCV_2895301 [Trichonephila clavipes]|nr:uncharacterized protein TNCV_2895301 [Trichonephila clavipes]
MLLKLIPSDLVLDYNKLQQKDSGSDIQQLLSFLTQSLTAREQTCTTNKSSFELCNRIQETKSNFSGEPRSYKQQNQKSFQTASEPLTAPVKENKDKIKLICIFCDSMTHNSNECECVINISLEERKNILLGKGACLNCLKIAKHLSGFTCPITLITELLIEECWKIETSWNSKLQIDIERKFERWKNQLIEIQDIKIPRRLSKLDFKDMNLSLQVFCDASKSSYARQNFRLPVILPSNHPVVKALIIYKHVQLGHAGVQMLIYTLRESYWILKGRKTIKEVSKTCIICKRFNAKLISVSEGLLPQDRPLTYVTDDVEDLESLTPAMFLQDIKEIGVPELDQIDENKLNKILVYRNRLQNDLRKRFRVEYLGQLRETRNIKGENTVSEGDIVCVLVGDDHTKRLNWNLGKILKLYPGKDKKVGVAQVKTKFGSFRCPLRKSYLLEVTEKNKSSVHPTNSPLFSDANEGSHLPINIDPELSKPQRAATSPMQPCFSISNGGAGLEPRAETSEHQQAETSLMQPCSSIFKGGAGLEPRAETSGHQ